MQLQWPAAVVHGHRGPSGDAELTRSQGPYGDGIYEYGRSIDDRRGGRFFEQVVRRWRFDSSGKIAVIPGPFDIAQEDPQNSKAIRSHWWRFANSQVVRVPMQRNV